MKIHFVLPPDSLRAVYAVPREPFVQDVACSHRALVTRYPQHTTSYEPVQEGKCDTRPTSAIIGMITSGTIIPADEPNDGSLFAFYYEPGRYTDAEMHELLVGVQQIGYQLYLQYQITEESQDGPIALHENALEPVV